ncbi:MAG TPA: hypothetical protein VGD42_00145 [Lysobacter sp.]
MSYLMQQEHRLLDLLGRHGAGGPSVMALDAWRAFKDFGRSIELDDHAGLLFQIGTYDFDGDRRFHFDQVLQLESVGDDGEHEGFEQLHCELTRPPAPELDGVATDLWSFAFADVEDFYAAVEAMPGFVVAVSQGPYRLRVRRERV